MKNVIYILFVLLNFLNVTFADVNKDTLKLTIKQMETLFQEKNLQLLAAKYNISSSKALEIQSSLWNNPTFSIEQNIYNKESGKYFDFTNSGNTDFALDQIITLGGKKGKQIVLAQINSQINENTYFDLLRNLKYQLRTDFFKLFFYRNSIKFYNETIPILNNTISIAEVGAEKKLLLLSEVIRLKSLFLSLQNEKLELQSKIDDLENDVCILLRIDPGSKPEIIPLINVESIEKESIKDISLESSINCLKENRPDLKISKLNVELENANLSLQKALAIPDLTIGFRYSRAGSYVQDYTALAIQMDLPFFNRNQGNIETSEFLLEAKKKLNVYNELTAISDVVSAFNKAKETDELFKKLDKKFSEQYKSLVDGMTISYQRKNITTIDYTDFLESYRNSMIQINQLYIDRLSSFEQLNLVIGKNLLNNSIE